MKDLFHYFFFFSLLVSVCLVLFQNYFKLIFQTFVSLLGFFGKVGNGGINGCGACQKYIEMGRGKKYLYTRLKGQ